MTIYLDNNATTATAPEVIAVMQHVLSEFPGNPSSIHRVGRAARARLEAAREEAATALGARPDELLFTGSGTEADTLAILGAVLAAPDDRRHLVVSAVEHPAVLEAARAAVNEYRAQLTLIAPDADGLISAAAVEAACRPDTLLVSVMAANNETGARMPVSQIAALCEDRDLLYHCDAVQAVAKIPIDFETLGCHLLSVSAHKFHGPKGAGLLLRRRGTRLHPVLHGGGQERGLRPGTESLAQAAGLSLALRLGSEAIAAGEGAPLAARRDRLEAGLLSLYSDAVVNGPSDPELRVPNTTNLSFPGVEAEALLIGLDREGICVSTGSACASGSVEPSHVLRAMQISPARLASSLRFSLSRHTTDPEIDQVLEVAEALFDRLR